MSGERFILHQKKILIWPDKHILVAADLHLGKDEVFLYGGLQQPAQEQWEELLDLENLAEEFTIEHIMFLGDFLHSPHGLTERIVQDFSDFLLTVDQQVTLIPSNRDKGALKLLGAVFPKMEVLYQWQIENFIFQHQPPDRIHGSFDQFFWCGHLNPTAQGQPCFVIDDNVGVLPAYSKVDGGNAVSARPGRRVYMCQGDLILES